MGRLCFCVAMLWGLVAPAAMAQDETAIYSVEVRFDWAAREGHPDAPHWSRLIAFTHTGKYALFRDGDTASSGLALLATNGRVGVLEAELAEGQRRNRVGAVLVRPGIATGVGLLRFEIRPTKRFSQLSLASMLAPSPDWFSGVSGLELRSADSWISVLRQPLWVWDAGADSGPDYTGPNADTQPRQSVRLLTHPDFLRPDGLRPIGHVTLTRIMPE